MTIHCPLPDETARLACVRGFTRASPRQSSSHTGQRQFHCGNAPPAAAPSTMAFRRLIQRAVCDGSGGSEFRRQIAVDLETEANFDEDRGRPGHNRIHSTARYNQSITRARNAASPSSGRPVAGAVSRYRRDGTGRAAGLPHHAKVIGYKPENGVQGHAARRTVALGFPRFAADNSRPPAPLGPGVQNSHTGELFECIWL